MKAMKIMFDLLFLICLSVTFYLLLAPIRKVAVTYDNKTYIVPAYGNDRPYKDFLCVSIQTGEIQMGRDTYEVMTQIYLKEKFNKGDQVK